MTSSTLIWREGLAGWTPAGELPELASVVVQVSNEPVAPGGVVAYATPTGQAYTNGFAITSLVCGILSVVSLFCIHVVAIVPGLVAVIFGHLGRGQIKRGKGIGGGLALAGLIMGYIGSALAVAIGVLIIAVIAYAPSAPVVTPPPAVPAKLPTTWPSSSTIRQPTSWPTHYPTSQPVERE